jgi:hypothetical protein
LRAVAARENKKFQGANIETGLQTAGRDTLLTTPFNASAEPVPTTSLARTGFQKHTFNAFRVDAQGCCK